MPCFDAYVVYFLMALETYVTSEFLHGVCILRLVACLGGKLTLEECWASWRRVLSLRWHGDTWLLAWRLVLDLRTLGLRNDHVSVVDMEEHMA
jgi:hypothetical protein